MTTSKILSHTNYKNTAAMAKHKNSSNIVSCVKAGAIMRIDCDKAVPYDLWDMDADRRIYRPLTKEERGEFVGCVLLYGRSPLPYRIFKLLILSLTKRVYPQHGAPNDPD